MDLQGFPYLPVNVDVGGYGPGHRSDHKLLRLRLQQRKHISNMAPGAMPWPRLAKLDYLFVSWFLFESTPFEWFNMLYYRFFSPLHCRVWMQAIEPGLFQNCCCYLGLYSCFSHPLLSCQGAFQIWTGASSRPRVSSDSCTLRRTLVCAYLCLSS